MCQYPFDNINDTENLYYPDEYIISNHQHFMDFTINGLKM